MTCLLCGLPRALKLLGLDKQNGKLVIITWSWLVTAGEGAKLVKYFQVRVFSIQLLHFNHESTGVQRCFVKFIHKYNFDDNKCMCES